MCEAYGKIEQTVRGRLRRGMTLEEALTTPIIPGGTNMKKVRYDHLGNPHESFVDMCKAWNKTENTVRSRLQRGETLEQALTRDNLDRAVKDENGVIYDNIGEMAKARGISRNTITNRLNAGMTLEEAVSMGKLAGRGISTACKDHRGTEYKSIAKMAEAHEIAVGTLRTRLKSGWTLEEALTTPTNYRETYRDHEGREFKGLQAMCKYHGISVNAYKLREKKGWSIEKILTTPTIDIMVGKKCVDHEGREFDNFTEMCRYYNKVPGVVQARLSRGWDLKDALTIGSIDQTKEIVSIFGKSMGIEELSIKCGISESVLRKRFTRGLEIDVAVVATEKSVDLKYIGLDGRAYYKVVQIDELMTARDVVKHFKPELICEYDKINPQGLYRPYKKGHKRMK